MSCGAAEVPAPLNGSIRSDDDDGFPDECCDEDAGSVRSVRPAEVPVSVQRRRPGGPAEEAARSLLLAQQKRLQLPECPALVPHTYAAFCFDRRVVSLLCGN